MLNSQKMSFYVSFSNCEEKGRDKKGVKIKKSSGVVEYVHNRKGILVSCIVSSSDSYMTLYSHYRGVFSRKRNGFVFIDFELMLYSLTIFTIHIIM